MGVNNLFLSLIRRKKKNSETFKEGKVTIVSGYLSATHCIQVGLHGFSVMFVFIKFLC